jgi:alpha-glucosidase
MPGRLTRRRSGRRAAAVAFTTIVSATLLVPVAGAALPKPEAGLGRITAVEQNGAQVALTAEEGAARVTFLEDDVLRVEADPSGSFTDPANDEPADPNAPDADIVVRDEWPGAELELGDDDATITVASDAVRLLIDKNTARMTLLRADGSLVWQETAPLSFDDAGATQHLARGAREQFLGGGMQNGRFSHRGQTIEIDRDFDWDDGGNPNAVPYYMSSSGYGVLRNTFAPGRYAFTEPVAVTHDEQRFDAYYFVGAPGDYKHALDEYTELTGRPMMPPVYGLEYGDADCYNRSNPSYQGERTPGKLRTPDAVAVAQDFVEHDMPGGWMLVNDGYGCEYVELEETGDAMRERGIEMGLWTERSLTEQEFEVGQAGVRLRKLDVAWVGQGYRMALSACEDAHAGIEGNSDARGFVLMVEAWAGAQRCAVPWTGDHSGSLDAVRWQVPAIHGSGNSGMAFTTGDVDGIFGGSTESYVRDLQWKAFAPALYSMSGWAAVDKRPWLYGEEATEINRRYLQLRNRLMPYIYTLAAQAHRTGTPVARSLPIEYPFDPKSYGEQATYQYLLGEDLLVAPVFTDSDVRDGIYLPEGRWIDYWNGTVYEGGRVLDGYSAPLDTLPLFVRAGAVLPMGPEGYRNAAEVPADAPVSLDVYPSGESSFTLYEDDQVTREHQAGAWSEQGFIASAPHQGRGTVSVTIGASEGDFSGEAASRPYELTVHTGSEPAQVRVGRELPLPKLSGPEAFGSAVTGWYYDAADRGGVVRLKTGPVPAGESRTVHLYGTSSVGGPRVEDGLAVLRAQPPELVAQGEEVELALTFTNGTAGPVRDIELAARLPQGWTPVSAEGERIRRLDAGQSATAKFRVRAGDAAEPGQATVRAEARYVSNGWGHSVSTAATTEVVYATLAASYNNVGVTDDGDTANGNFDLGGNSYSAQALAAAGVSPGGTVSAGGVDFTWPSAEPGTPNNTVFAGQTIKVSGMGTHIAFLGAEAGQQAGTVTIRYTDGTTQRRELRLPNWCCLDPTAGGSQIAVTTNYRNTQDGPANHGTEYRLFTNQVRTTPGKEIYAVTFSDTQALHVFDMRLVTRELPAPPSGQVWASDVPWMEATNGWGPVERDTSNGESAAGDGHPITLDGRTYDKGLGVHAASRITYYLGGRCDRFVSDVGVDDEIADYGSVIFTVVADGVEKFRSSTMTGTFPTEHVDVDVTGAQYVELVVDPAGNNAGDHADWAGSAFTCA